MFLFPFCQFSQFFSIRMNCIYFFLMNFILDQFFSLVEDHSVCYGFILKVFHFCTFFFRPFVKIFLFFRYQVIKSCRLLWVYIFVPIPILDLAVDSGTKVYRAWHCHAVIVLFRESGNWIRIDSSKGSALRLRSWFGRQWYIFWQHCHECTCILGWSIVTYNRYYWGSSRCLTNVRQCRLLVQSHCRLKCSNSHWRLRTSIILRSTRRLSRRLIFNEIT